MNISYWAKSRKNGWTIGLALLTLVLTFVLWATSIMAQGQELMLSIVRIDSQDYPNLSAYVNVIDQSGMLQTDLQANHFEMSEDQNKVNISLSEVVSDTREGLFLLLALDTSMNKEEFAEIQKHVKAFIKTMTAQDQISILTFADEIGKQAQVFTDDQRQLSNFVDSLSSTYKETKVTYSAVDRAMELAARQEGRGHSAVILLTDSGNVGDATSNFDKIILEEIIEKDNSKKEMLEKIKEKKIPLYVVGFGPNIKTDDLQSLTEQIIGQSYFLTDSTSVEATLNYLRAELRKGYRLRWNSELSADEKSHELLVNLASGTDDPVTKSFTITNSWSVNVAVEALTEAEVVTEANVKLHQFSVGECVRLQAKVEGREVSHVEFFFDKSLVLVKEDADETKCPVTVKEDADETKCPVTVKEDADKNKSECSVIVKEEPYEISVAIPNEPQDSYQVRVEVEDARGNIKEGSIDLEVLAASVGLWQRFGPILWRSLLLIILLLLTLWLLAYLLAWQRRKVRQKFALKIKNEGNTTCCYELRAEQMEGKRVLSEKEQTLSFEFYDKNQDQLLKPRQAAEPEPEPTASSPSQNAPAEESDSTVPNSTTEQESKKTENVADKAQEMGRFVSNLAAVLGPFGGPFRSVLNTVTQTSMSARYISQTPARIFGRLGISFPKWSFSSSTLVGGTTVAGTTVGRTTSRSQSNQSQKTSPIPRAAQPVVMQGVETPKIEPAQSSDIVLSVIPPWHFSTGGNYTFKITAHLLDQQIPQFKERKGQLDVGKIRWHSLLLLLSFLITLLISGTLAYFIIQ